MDVEEQVERIEEKIPGIARRLRPYIRSDDGLHSNGHVSGIDYLETPNYHIVGAKWHDRTWSRYRGGIAWADWATVYYIKKDDGSLNEIQLEAFATKDPHNSNKDRRDLWGYNNIRITPLFNNEVAVVWVNEEGESGPIYRVNLDDQE